MGQAEPVVVVGGIRPVKRAIAAMVVDVVEELDVLPFRLQGQARNLFHVYSQKHVNDSTSPIGISVSVTVEVTVAAPFHK